MGVRGGKEVAQAILDDRPELDVETARADVGGAARRLVDEHPELGAIVLECTNMAPYRASTPARQRVRATMTRRGQAIRAMLSA